MVLIHIIAAILALSLLWVASRLVISAIDGVSKRIHISGFTISFIVLGMLTSLTEISVGLNAVIAQKPGIFVGNLIGGSFVILLFIIPLLAIGNGGIIFAKHLRPRRLLLFLVLIFSPAVLILDGAISYSDAAVVILIYGAFVYLMQKQEGIVWHGEEVAGRSAVRLSDAAKVLAGTALMFGASKILISETVYFAEILNVSSFLISMIVLAIGTNLPELMVAINAIRAGKSEIAFGDYVGSAAANALIFGVLSFINGPYAMDTKGYLPTFAVLIVGYTTFFLFARSKKRLSAIEGVFLLIIFMLFLLIQGAEIIQYAR